MIRYYLFGGDAVATYENDGAKTMVSDEQEYTIPYQTVEFNTETDDINYLLSEFCGWDNYIELDKEEYEEIINLEKELV